MSNVYGEQPHGNPVLLAAQLARLKQDVADGQEMIQEYDLKVTDLRAQLAAVTAERDEAWRNIEEEAAFVALKAAIERAGRKRCPCEFGSPCHDQCSCTNPVASGGCRRCCTFGSPEQQAGMAKVLIEKEQRAEKAETRAVAHWAECEAWRRVHEKPEPIHKFNDDGFCDRLCPKCLRLAAAHKAREASDRARAEANPTYTPPTEGGENP